MASEINNDFRILKYYSPTCYRYFIHEMWISFYLTFRWRKKKHLNFSLAKISRVLVVILIFFVIFLLFTFEIAIRQLKIPIFFSFGNIYAWVSRSNKIWKLVKFLYLWSRPLLKVCKYFKDFYLCRPPLPAACCVRQVSSHF